MTTVAALAILLISITCTRLLGMVSAWQYLRERDLMFFEAYEAMFFVAITSLRRCYLDLEVLILEKEIRGRDCPI